MTYKITESKLSTILKNPTKAERIDIGCGGLERDIAKRMRVIVNKFFEEDKQDRYWHIEKE